MSGYAMTKDGLTDEFNKRIGKLLKERVWLQSNIKSNDNEFFVELLPTILDFSAEEFSMTYREFRDLKNRIGQIGIALLEIDNEFSGLYYSIRFSDGYTARNISGRHLGRHLRKLE